MVSFHLRLVSHARLSVPASVPATPFYQASCLRVLLSACVRFFFTLSGAFRAEGFPFFPFSCRASPPQVGISRRFGLLARQLAQIPLPFPAFITVCAGCFFLESRGARFLTREFIFTPSCCVFFFWFTLLASRRRGYKPNTLPSSTWLSLQGLPPSPPSHPAVAALSRSQHEYLLLFFLCPFSGRVCAVGEPVILHSLFLRGFPFTSRFPPLQIVSTPHFESRPSRVSHVPGFCSSTRPFRILAWKSPAFFSQGSTPPFSP